MTIVKDTAHALKKENVKESSNKIEATVQDIFKTCKLSPEADAAIHPILAEVLDGAALLKSSQKKSGHQKIHKALTKYEQLFQ